MKEFELKNGNVITPKLLRQLEDEGRSEEYIGAYFDISRQYLHRIRKKLGCPVRFRSDRGVERKSKEEKRSKRAENARRRYIPVDSELVHCYFCGGVWDSSDGIKAQERGKEMRYACGDCCRGRFSEGEIEEKSMFDAIRASVYQEEDVL